MSCGAGSRCVAGTESRLSRLGLKILFQPPYSPQINPIERLWKHLKQDLKWGLFEDLDALRNTVQKILPKLSRKVISSLTGWKFIVDAVCIAGI